MVNVNLVTNIFKQPLIEQLPIDTSQTNFYSRTVFNYFSTTQDLRYIVEQLFESRKLVNEY